MTKMLHGKIKNKLGDCKEPINKETCALPAPHVCLPRSPVHLQIISTGLQLDKLHMRRTPVMNGCISTSPASSVPTHGPISDAGSDDGTSRQLPSCRDWNVTD